MSKKILTTILISVSVIAISFSIFIEASLQKNNAGTAAIILHLAEQNKKIRVLIVPGHEPNAGGADEYKKIKERDLNLQLAKLIKDKLFANNNIDVVLARDNSGWNSELKNYVEKNKLSIMNWVLDMKNKMMANVKLGDIKLINPGMKHNAATSNAVLFLYGTNKWIAENNIDLVLNVHFNNNPKIYGKPNYRGYAMYVPEKQYSNSSSSKIFANYVNAEISKIQKPSNMPQEKNTIIEDQQLIAVGNYNTLKIPAIVVEYAYIYEPMMVSSSTRNNFIEKAASSTATAINNYITNELKK